MVRITEKILEPSTIYEKQVFKLKLRIQEDKDIINYTTEDLNTDNIIGSLPQYAE